MALEMDSSPGGSENSWERWLLSVPEALSGGGQEPGSIQIEGAMGTTWAYWGDCTWLGLGGGAVMVTVPIC